MTQEQAKDPLWGLDSVEWDKLGHAYGFAKDVPDLLKGLRSRDATVRQKSLYELYGNVWHQGTVYEATAPVVPFLIRLAAASDTPERPMLLVFLSELFNGSSYVEVHGKGKSQTEEEFQERLARERQWVKDTRDAVVKDANLLVTLLDDSSTGVQIAAAYLLGAIQVYAVDDIVVAEQIARVASAGRNS